MKHLDRHNNLNFAQHGFRKNRSTESQLILSCNEHAKGLNSGKQRDSIILDFSKAFDKVPHKRLLLKLKQYDICRKILNWIQDSLRNMDQSVVVDAKLRLLSVSHIGYHRTV